LATHNAAETATNKAAIAAWDDANTKLGKYNTDKATWDAADKKAKDDAKTNADA